MSDGIPDNSKSFKFDPRALRRGSFPIAMTDGCLGIFVTEQEWDDMCLGISRHQRIAELQIISDEPLPFDEVK